MRLRFGFYSLFGTAFIFHIVAIFAEAGRSSTEAFAYFFPLAIVSVSVNLTSSWLSDRTRLKNLLVVKLMAFILGAWGLLHLHEQSGYWTMVAGFGACGGIWAALSNLAFIRFFRASAPGANQWSEYVSGRIRQCHRPCLVQCRL